MDMLISLIVVIIWQCVHMSKHHVVCLEYVQFLFVSYIHLKKAGKQCWIKFKKEAVWTAPAQSGHQPHGADIRGWRRGILTWLGLQTAPRKPEQERRQTAAMIWAEKPRLWANVKCCLRTKINARGYSQGAEGPRIGGRSESQRDGYFISGCRGLGKLESDLQKSLNHKLFLGFTLLLKTPVHFSSICQFKTLKLSALLPQIPYKLHSITFRL